MNIEKAPCVAYIKSPAPDKFVGHVVDVLRYEGIGPDGPCWLCFSHRPLEVYESVFPRNETCIPDFVLTPITGLPLNEEVPEELKVTA